MSNLTHAQITVAIEWYSLAYDDYSTDELVEYINYTTSEEELNAAISERLNFVKSHELLNDLYEENILVFGQDGVKLLTAALVSRF